MKTVFRWLGLLTLLAATLGARADGPWIRANDFIYQIDSSTNQISRTLEVNHADAIAADESGVWILAKDILSRFASSPAAVWSLDVKPPVKKAEFLALSSRNQVAWVGGKEKLLRISLPDYAASVFAFDGKDVKAVDVGLDGSFWALGKDTILRYSVSGAAMPAIDLRSLNTNAKVLKVDSLGGGVWLAGDDEVLFIDPEHPTSSPVRISLPKKADDLALDPSTGRAWVLAKDNLYQFSASGAQLRNIDVKALGLKDPKAVGFDPVTGAVWLLHKDGVSRFNEAGALVATVVTSKNPDNFSAAPFRFDPSVAVTAPAHGSLTANPTPALTLTYGATCSGVPCASAIEEFAAYRLSALLNGSEIGSLFTLQAGTGNATAIPAARLPEGENVLRARVTDSFGTVSAHAESRFLVDTVAPAFTAVSPTDGATFSTPGITIAGSVGEAATIALTGDGVSASAAGTSFSFPVTLRSGANSYVLSATDAVGNRSDLSVHYQLAVAPPPPLEFTTVLPADGSSSSSSSIVISGTLNHSAIVSLSGSGTSQTAQGATFSFNVTLQSGENTFTLSAVDPAGSQATRTLRITLSGGLQLTITSPANGSTISSSMVSVTGTFSGEQNVGINVNGMVATTFGNQFAATFPIPAGTVQLVVVAKGQSGATTQQTITVNAVTSTSRVELTLEPPVGIAPFTATVTVPRLPPELPSVWVAVDFNGDGVFEANLFGEGQRATYTYSTPGIYIAKIQLYDFGTATYFVHEVPVVVQDLDAIDSRIRAVINGVFDRLKARDIDGALTAFEPTSAGEYRTIFTGMLSDLPAIADQLGTVADGAIYERFAEYMIVQATPGGPEAFVVTLKLGKDGVWRITQM